MDSVLRKIYYGVMDGTQPYPRNGEHRRQVNDFADKAEEFSKRLSPELRREYRELENAALAVCCEDECYAFTDGFRLGALTMLEVLTGE